MTPAEQAALSSACFDGHEGSLYSHSSFAGTEGALLLGVKTADPSMLVSMGGSNNPDQTKQTRTKTISD